MSFWDRFRQQAPAAPKIADSQKDKDKSVLAAGSIYFVKWTNAQCTMSDTAKFYNEHEANIFIEDCRLQGYYVQAWHESLNEQVAAEVAKIKAELEQVKQEEVNRYIYQYRMAKIDLEKIRDDYESLLDEVEKEQAKKVEAKEQPNIEPTPKPLPEQALNNEPIYTLFHPGNKFKPQEQEFSVKDYLEKQIELLKLNSY